MNSIELVGQTIAGGRYQIVRLLGEGGMGAVYQARQVAMDRMVALKLIRAEFVKQTPEAAARFGQEMRVTARVEHPNTIRVYDYGEAEGNQLFLTMEYLPGRSLAAEIEAAGRLPLERIVRIGRQISNALGAAHAAGVVHRDLKPENVMLVESFGEPDFVKVVDFGVAKSLDDNNPKLTAAGGIVGTPAYMAPEQALGKPVDARTDLYALGVMLFHMAAGEVPFMAPTMGSLLVAHATQPPPPLSSFVPDVSAGLAALIMQLLEKEPAARPASAAEVGRRLEALLAPTTAVVTTVARPGSRSKIWVWLTAALGLAVVAGIVAAAMMGGNGAGPTAAPDAAAVVVTPPDAAAVVVAPPDAAAVVVAPPDAGPSCADRVAAAKAELDRDAAAGLALAEEATRACPAESGAYNMRGNALQKLGKLDDAEDAYVHALSLSPDNDVPRFNLGLLQLRRKDASAAGVFSELLRRNPDYPNAHLLRAQAYVLQGKHDLALADLEEETRRQPSNADVWLQLGQLRDHLKKGDAQEAYCKAKALGKEGVEAFCKE